jgi:CSLREA domain-containing protein
MLLLSIGVMFSADPAAAQTSTFTVDSTSDGADANAGNGVCATAQGVCTLRAAMEEANLHRGPDAITFNIPGPGVKTITLGSTLPEIKDTSGPTTIDGYTQPGSAPNTDPLASNAAIMVQITAPGTYTSNIYGITVRSPGNTIRGLSFFKLRKPINITGSRAANNTIAGNFIGTDAAGSFGATTFLSDGNGVTVQSGAQNNTIGGTSPADRNVLSGNARHGVSCYFDGTDHNRIINNIMGLSPAGDRRLTNLKHGVDINNGCSDTQVGGTQPGERNVISGNTEEGVEISHLAITTQNKVIGNFFGTDLTGEAAPTYARNGRRGVHLEDRSIDTTIAYNVIGNSGLQAIRGGPSVHGTVIEHNWIGISPGGTPIPNANVGVKIEGDSSGWRIGPGNVIANNGSVGVRIDDANSDRNTITRNSIFANAGLGIDIQPIGQSNPNDEGDADTGANEQLNFPVLKTATPLKATGTACASCTIEVFLADDGAGANGEGKTFVSSSTTNSDGNFAVPLDGVVGGNFVTATATDAAGNTSEFSLNKVVSEDITAPEAPTGLTATASEATSVALDWNDNSEPDLAGYSVYRSTTSGGPYTKLTSSLLSASSYTDTAVSSGTTYYYVVTATDAMDNESPNSNEASTSTAADTTPPETTIDSGPTGTVSIASATFEFSSSEAGSAFECSLDGAPFSGCASPKDYTSLADGSHTFEVRAIDAAGNTDPTPAKRSWTVDATAPSVQPPQQNLALGTTLGTFAVPVKLTWSATDSTSTVAKYELQQSTNGAAYTNVSLSSPTTTVRTVSLEPGITYQFRVRAQDSAGNWSDWMQGPAFTVEDNQESSAAISYIGTWTQEALDSAFGGGVSYAEAAGAKATFTFTGSHVAWVAPKDANRGRAEVWVDGVKVRSVDLYASSEQPRKMVFTQDWASVGTHTVEVRALGTKNASSSGTRVDVDAFVVLR